MKTLTSRMLQSSFLVLAVSAAAACGSDDSSPPRAPGQAAGGSGGTAGASGTTGSGGAAGGGLSGGSGGVPGSGGAAGGVAGSSGVSGGTGTAGTTGTGGSAGAAGAIGAGGSAGTGGAPGSGGAAGAPGAGGATTDGGPSASEFWGDTTTIPVAKNVMTFKFINRTNGKFPDSKVYWSFKSGTIDELHPLSELSTYDMPANASGRMYFYIVTDPANPLGSAAAPRTSKYNDFIEHTIGAATYNGNTTRVDAFALKIAMRMHCSDGYDIAVGEDYATFAESREATFAKFIAETPPEFAHLAQAPFAPYRIARPESGNFGNGKSQANYMVPWVDELWAANSLTVAKPNYFCGPIAGPTLSASCHRHVGAGALNTDGTLKAGNALWASHATFYPKGPANYFAKFWHDHALGQKAYGFPYDDVGGWSTYVSHKNPQWMIVAIGW